MLSLQHTNYMLAWKTFSEQNSVRTTGSWCMSDIDFFWVLG